MKFNLWFLVVLFYYVQTECSVVQNRDTVGGNREVDLHNIDISEDCGGTFTDPSGEFHSPNYPYNYPGYTACQYVIELPVGQKVHLDVVNFDLPDTQDCYNNYLTIWDDGGSKSYTYCGTDIPNSISLNSNKITLLFYNNNIDTHTGFSMVWHATRTTAPPTTTPPTTIAPTTPKTDCGGSFTSLTGEFHSPNYPNNYPGYTACQYVIELPVGQKVHLDVVNFDLPDTQDCYNNYLTIWDDGGSKSYTYCGTDIPNSISLNSNKITLLFYNNNIDTHTGFIIVWYPQLQTSTTPII